jgi:hypothetical protein
LTASQNPCSSFSKPSYRFRLWQSAVEIESESEKQRLNFLLQRCYKENKKLLGAYEEVAGASKETPRALDKLLGASKKLLGTSREVPGSL